MITHGIGGIRASDRGAEALSNLARSGIALSATRPHPTNPAVICQEVLSVTI
jgi:hypothetical protein